MTKPTGFILSGPIGCINVQTSGADDWREVTDLETLAKVCKNAHVSSGEDFAEYSDHYGTVYGGEMSFEMRGNQAWVDIQYRFDEWVEIIEEDDIIIIDGATRSLAEVIDEIANETSGQCSDGIGEGYEQYPCYEADGSQYYISLGYPEFADALTYT